MADENILHITLNVEEMGQFKGEIDGVIKVVGKLNTAIAKLADSLDNLGKAFSVGKSPNFQQFQATMDALSKIDAPSRTQTDKISRAFIAIRNMMDDLDTVQIDRSKLTNLAKGLGQFTIVAAALSVALKQFDRIKSPETLVVVSRVLPLLKTIIDELSNVQAKITRASLSNLAKNMAQMGAVSVALSFVLKQFDRIQKPENLLAVEIGVRALTNVIEWINKGILSSNTNFVTAAQRLVGLTAISKILATSIKFFDKIEKPKNVSAASEAINAVRMLLVALDGLRNRLGGDTKFDDVLQFLGFGKSIGRGLTDFFKSIAKGLQAFSKIPTNSVNNLEKIGMFLRSVASMIRVMKDSFKVTLQGGGADDKLEFGRSIGSIFESVGKALPILAQSLKAMDKVKIKNLDQIIRISEVMQALILIAREIGKIEQLPSKEIAVRLKDLIVEIGKALSSIGNVKVPANIDKIIAILPHLNKLSDVDSLSTRNAGKFGLLTNVIAGTLRGVYELTRIDRLIQAAAQGIVYALVQVPIQLATVFVAPFVRLFSNLAIRLAAVTLNIGFNIGKDIVSRLGFATIAISAALVGMAVLISKKSKVVRNALLVFASLFIVDRLIFAPLRRAIANIAVMMGKFVLTILSPLQNLGRLIVPLLSGIGSAFAKIVGTLASATSAIARGIGAAFSTAFRTVFSVAGQIGKLALDAGKTAGRLIVSGISLAVKAITFPANIFNSLLTAARHVADNIYRTFIGLSQNLRRFGREMSMLGTQMLATGGVSGFVQSKAVGMVMDFEVIMKQIQVLGGVVGDELTKAEQFILQLGESSVFTASEVASAFLDLSKAGLSFDQISVSLGGMLDLAAAGGMTVSESAQLVINAVKSMGLSFDDTTRIVDLFVAAANIGVATVPQLAHAFGYVGNTAGAFGQEIEQVTAALTLMMDKGVPDERAGTSLDAFFRSLIDPSEEASGIIVDLSQRLMELEKSSGVLTDLGVSFKGDLAGLMTDELGNYRDLNEIIKLITIATKDMTESQRASMLETLAGSANAGRALLALTGQYEDGTFVLDEYIKKQEGAASAAATAAAVMDTARGDIEQMRGALETLLKKALDPVIEYGIRPLTQGVTFLIRQLSQLPQPVLAVVAAFVGLSTTLMTLVGGMLLFGGITAQIIGFAITPLISLLWSLLNPLKAIILLTAGQGILAALFVGGAILVPLILSIIAGVKAFKAGMDDLQGSAIMTAFSDSFTRLKEAITGVLSAGARFLDIVWALTSPSGNAENTGLVAFIITQITNLLNVASDAIEPLSDLFNMLSGFASVKMPSLGGIVEGVTGSSGGFGLGNFMSKIGEETSSFSDGMKVFEAVKKSIALSSYNFSADMALAKKAFEAGEFNDVLDNVEGFFNRSGKSSAKLVSNVTTLSTKFRSIDQVLQMLDEDSQAFKILSDSLEPFADNPIIEMIFGKDVTGQDLARTLSVLISTLINLRDVGSSVLRRFTEFFDDLRNGIGVTKSFSNLIKGLIVDAGRLAAVFLDVVTNMLGIEGFEGIIANLAQGNLRGALTEFGKFIAQTLFNGLKSAIELGGKVITWSWSKLIDFVDDVNWAIVWDKVIDGITAIVDVTSGVIAWSWDKLITFYDDINWGAQWDKIKPDVDTFLAEKIVIPLADIFSFDLPTRQIESDSIIPLTVTDTDSIIGTISTITSAIEELFNGLKDAVSGPGVDLIKGTIEDIANALKSFTELDSSSLKAIAIVALPFVAGLIAAASVPALAAVASITLIRGLAKAIPDLVDAFNKLTSGDWQGAWNSFKDAVVSGWGGIKDSALKIVDFIATLLGAKDFASEENFQKGIDAWNTMGDQIGDIFDALWDRVYLGFLQKVVQPIVTGDIIQLADALGADIDVAGIRTDIQAEITRLQLEMGIASATIPITPEFMATDPEAIRASISGIINAALMGYTIEDTTGLASALMTAFSSPDISSAITQALSTARMDPTAFVPGTTITYEEALRFAFGVDSTTFTAALAEGLNVITSAITPTGQANINTWLTGKTDGSPLGAPDILDAPGIATAAVDATTAVNTFSTNATSDIGAVRSQIQGLATDFSNLATWAWLIEVTPMGGDTGMGPAPQRALGGPVFAGKLYEVAEKGMSELLRIGQKTFLIPGERGVVVPAASSPATTPTNFQSTTTNYGGGIYTDHSMMVIQIDASDLSASELRDLVQEAVGKKGDERTRSIRRRLQAAGRGGR